jgi:hypothetical protein
MMGHASAALATTCISTKQVQAELQASSCWTELHWNVLNILTLRSSDAVMSLMAGRELATSTTCNISIGAKLS